MLFVKYKNGRRLQGILLALGDQLVRVAIKGADDSVTFRLVNGVWVSEDCEAVTFEFAENGFPAHEVSDFRDTVFANPIESAEVQRVM